MQLTGKWYEFAEHPSSDSCWSLSTGPDGRIYSAACSEGDPGNTVKVVRYNREQDKLDYLLDFDKAVNDPRDSGRATQCKIHYSFAPSKKDGIMYMASHLSGPPIDLAAYSPWNFWHNEERCFRGSALLAYDTRTDQVLWWNTLIPKEGCRCLVIDEERDLLYALSYPRDHLYQFDLKTKNCRDLGRIGSVNAQVLIIDKYHRVWTSSDYGRVVRYDPEKDRMEESPYLIPHNSEFQTGWHSVFYDAALAPDGESVYTNTWIAQPRLSRLWLYEGDWGRMEDLGPATQERDTSLPISTFLDHCGGLTFARDGHLYYVVSRWKEDGHIVRDMDINPERTVEGIIMKLNTETLIKEEAGRLERPGYVSQYVSRGAMDAQGDLFFGHVGQIPVGIFKVDMPKDSKQTSTIPLRVWG